MIKYKIPILFMILFLLFSESILFSQNNAGILIANKVNLRENATVKSKSLGFLNKNSKVEIIEESTKIVIISKYYGKWLKVKTEDNKIGYMLSCFVKYKGNEGEKFHLFFNNFFNSFVKKKNSSYIKRIKFPILMKGYHTEGEWTDKATEKKHLKTLLACTNEKPMFSIEKKMIKVLFDCDGCGQGRAWFFKKVARKWFLVGAELYEY